MKTERKQSRREKVPKKPAFNGPSDSRLQTSGRASDILGVVQPEIKP